MKSSYGVEAMDFARRAGISAAIPRALGRMASMDRMAWLDTVDGIFTNRREAKESMQSNAGRNGLDRPDEPTHVDRAEEPPRDV